MRGAETPVDVQVLGQEGRGDEPGPVVHEPLDAELPHARVDERIAGAAVLPGLERLARRRATGLREDAGPRSRSRGARRTAGSGSRASRAGARTPHRLLDRLCARRPREAKGTRSAGTPRAVTSSRRRARLCRSRTRRARLASHASSRARPADSPPPGRLGDVEAVVTSSSSGSRPGSTPSGSRIASGGSSSAPSRLDAPAVPVRREHGEVVAATRGRELAGRDHRDACEHANVEARRLAGAARAAGHTSSRPRRGRPASQPSDGDLGDDVAAPHDQRAAEGSQRLVEIPERVEQERDAIRRAERPRGSRRRARTTARRARTPRTLHGAPGCRGRGGRA